MNIKQDNKSYSFMYFPSTKETATKTKSLPPHPGSFLCDSGPKLSIGQGWGWEAVPSNNFGEIFMIKYVVEISGSVTKKLILYLQIKNIQIKIKYQNRE